MSLLRVVTVAAALVACGGTPKRVRKPGDDYLTAIRFEGVSLSHDGLLSGLALKRNLDAGRSLDEYQLQLDTERIIGLYQTRGYFSVQVTPRVERNGDAITLIFAVVEGPQSTASVVISGLPPEISQDEARALVELENGAPFDYDVYAAAKAPMLAMVENAGYAHAQLDARVLVDRTKAHATLRYTVDPGPRVTFGPITISGVKGALAEAARNRMTVREGEPYSTKAVAQAQEAIRGIGRFSSVRVDVDRMGEATVVPVKVMLTETTRWETQLGGGAGFDTLTYWARLRAIVTHEGWPTPLTKLGAEFRPAYTVERESCGLGEVWSCEYEPRIRLIGTAAQRDFLRRDVTADAEGGLDYSKIEAYTMKGARALFGVGSPIGRHLQARIGWQLAYYQFDDISPAVDDATAMELGIKDASNESAVERLGALTESIAVDFRDNAVSPRFGAYGELRVTHGGKYAGSAYNYLQLVPDLRGYLPLGRSVLALKGRLGVIYGDVPPTERFYAGGASSQRGFPERNLSPAASNVDAMGNTISVPIGGAAMIETSVELRTPFKLFGIPMRGSLFLDGGDVTKTPSELQLGNLNWAVGVGWSPYMLPIGPIRLELAYRLNRTGPTDPLPGQHWNFVFSLGEAF